jgi:hypothetical protein
MCPVLLADREQQQRILTLIQQSLLQHSAVRIKAACVGRKAYTRTHTHARTRALHRQHVMGFANYSALLRCSLTCPCRRWKRQQELHFYVHT